MGRLEPTDEEPLGVPFPGVTSCEPGQPNWVNLAPYCSPIYGPLSITDHNLVTFPLGRPSDYRICAFSDLSLQLFYER
jgi:hypothetical protein